MNTLTISQLYTEVKAMHPQLDKRLDKAVNLVNGGGVRHETDGTYLVKSLTTGLYYGVGFEPVTSHKAGWSCGCADIKNGAPTLDFCGSVQSRICKHIIAASLTWILEDQAAPEPAFIQEAPQWSIESAAGFTAEVSRDGQVSYTDKIVEIAKAEGATHRRAATSTTFYRREPHQTMVGNVVDSEFTGWEFKSTYPPELAIEI